MDRRLKLYYEKLSCEVLSFNVLDSNIILDFFADKGIENLYHFTPVKNLYSILINGICPVNELKRRNIQFIQPDNKRLDGRLNAVSLSISNPNKKLLEKKILWEMDIPFCIIEIDSSVLFELECTKEFFYTNAARFKTVLRDYQFTSVECLESMFKDDTNIPADEQAEVLFHGIIPTKYIKCVYFQYDDEILNELSVFGNLFVVDWHLFGFYITKVL